MPKPLISFESVYDASLKLLDERGEEALSIRSLASELACSTRTLYIHYGKRDELIQRLLAHHFSGIALDFRQGLSWQEGVISWAAATRMALMEHPNLSRLMSIENRSTVVDYVNQLLKMLLKSEFSETLALRSCRVLTHLVVSLTFTEIDTPSTYISRRKRSRKEIEFEDLMITSEARPSHGPKFQSLPEVFSNSLAWIITGIEKELACE